MIILLTSILFYLQGFVGCTDPKLRISHLSENFYIYTTYKDLNGTKFPSNSMYLVTNEGVVLFDTPWDTSQFQPLFDSIAKRHHKKVVLAISTHHHDDRTAGLEFLRSKGVKTYTSKLTHTISKAKNEKTAEFQFLNDTIFRIGGHTIQTFYPGHGHAKDNIVLWFEKEKILYGGCFVKSLQNNNLGNLEDADVKKWRESVKKVIGKFGSPTYVIPGHFDWIDKNALEHTLMLIDRHLKESAR